jgi:uncharacterized protein
MPTVWILTCGRIGDLKQMQALASSLGWPTETKQISFENYPLSNLTPFAPWLLTRTSRETLKAPLPDLLLSAESRASSVAAWLCKRTGRKTKSVCLTRPRGKLSDFDLIITSPHYGLPRLPNIIEILLPITSEVAESKLAHPGRTRIALLVGGASAPYQLDAAVARNMVKQVSDYVVREDGELSIITSARTGKIVENVLAEETRGLCELHRWSNSCRANSYTEKLTESDAFIVTADSVSMLAETIATGKPVILYDLPVSWKFEHRLIQRLWRIYGQKRPTLATRPIAVLFEFGIIEPRADRAILHSILLERKLICRFGAKRATSPVLPFKNDIALAVAAIKRLF